MSIVTNFGSDAQLSTFDIDIRYRPGTVEPQTIFITPVVTHQNIHLTPTDWIRAAHIRMIQTAHEAIYQYNHWTLYEQDHRVVGNFQMRNIDDTSRSAMESFVRLGNLTAEQFENIFDRATRPYNNQLTPTMVEWAYWIDPQSMHLGHGGNSKPVMGLYDLTCKDQPEISCAAASIIFHFIMKSNQYSQTFKHHIRRQTNRTKWWQDAYQLQNKMGWNKTTTLHDVQQVVDTVYPDHRIVIVNFLTACSKSTSKNGPDYIQEPTNKKIIYLFYDYENHHFCTISSPEKFIRSKLNNNSIIWCHSCTSYSCECDIRPPPRKRKICHHCKLEWRDLSHNCFHQSCRDCYTEFRAGHEMDTHRCALRANLNTRPIDFESGESKSKQLWAYDFESAIQIDPNDNTSFRFPINPTTHQYEIDSENEQEDQPQKIFTPINTVAPSHKQVPNYVVYQNVFTGEIRETNNIKEFLEDMLFKTNKGNNILVAHNASGYDSRLVFDEINQMTGTHNSIINRGSKILRMQVGKTTFIDSMLHLPGSLKSLSGEYLKENTEYQSMTKGYFPHLFNTVANQNYIGPTPPIEYYDLTSFCNDTAELEIFYTYYNSISHRTDWNLQEELKLYCRQDVHILAGIMKLHHEQCLEALTSYTQHLKISPWHYTTSAGYVHKLNMYDMELNASSLPSTERAKNSWCVLKPVEYYFVRIALRGGHTETRIYFYEGPIADLDINSQYPYVQMAKNIKVCGKNIPIRYPVGYPTIEILDLRYFPCDLHAENPTEICKCTLAKKRHFKSIKTVYKEITVEPQEYHNYINNFFGFLMVDVTPPTDLYNPVLPIYDQEKEKCIYSNEPIIRGVYCSTELQIAIQKGYNVTKIYQAHRYNSAPTPWGGEDGGLMGVFNKMKIMNSSKVPPLAQQPEMARYYKENFDVTLDFNPTLWDKRPAAKKTAKILCNSAWGKHAESVDHEKVIILDQSNGAESDLLMRTFSDRTNQMKSFNPLANNNMMVKYKPLRHKNPPDLTKAYLPCAVFVPMYGRLTLYNVLDQCGEDVIMMDTDSIKVKSSALENLDISIGNYLGQWENESGDDPLVGFISLGPKSYGQKFASGKTTFKSKGVSLKLAHQSLINYEIAKEIYFDDKIVYIPQTVFSYKFSKGISTRQFLKKISFQEHALKGILNRTNHKLYPFGFNNNSTT